MELSDVVSRLEAASVSPVVAVEAPSDEVISSDVCSPRLVLVVNSWNVVVSDDVDCVED